MHKDLRSKMFSEKQTRVAALVSAFDSDIQGIDGEGD